MVPSPVHGLFSRPASTVPALSSFPPNSNPPPLFPRKLHHPIQPSTAVSRRDLVSLSSLSLLPPLLRPSPATAFSIGISGPKDWLKEQKKKTSKFLFAPVDASRQSLRTAYLLLTTKDSDYSDKDMEEIQSLLRSAARDCVPGERNSFVSFQAKTGVEVCTFRLIVNNASSLLRNKDPVKLQAEAILNYLIRSFASLQDVANEADIKLPSERQRMADSLMATISSLDKFEQGVKDCLEV
ncbi:hypothetical protein TIFTF001_005355 [Ficus carica]|uniref:Chloroplast thylakoid membrane n=1 Tax=Ficus carica TaxID=3494 RepID=A0AA87ZLI6_FICCA|nr:hypothetical protein TIFTF001_005355 [Ficus carica]